VSEPEHVSPLAFRELLSSEVGEGWTEFSCHPGYCSPEHAASVYYEEREVEVGTLTDPGIRREIERLGIRLASYADFNRAQGVDQGVPL
jgi:predicted glycoside hydrolase/deacetylase ChbG (UPF0249 family)